MDTGRQSTERHDGISRRDVLRTTAASAALAAASIAPALYAAGNETVRIGLVGCGRRGTGAAQDCCNSAPNVELVAMGDLFKDNLDGAYAQLKGMGSKFKVTPEKCFHGFDAYLKVINSGIDLVLLVTPPGFRWEQFRAAVEAGKHVFMEKPVAVCPATVKSVLAASDTAKSKGLSVVAGTQRRHQPCYVEAMKRIHGGDIGQITAAQCYWMGDYGYYPAVRRKPGWTDMEAQCRNWNYYTWLSGDHIVEQHVHNLDIMRWALRGDPVRCIANGSRAVRTGSEFGHTYDNFSVSYEFPDGVFVLSMSRQMSNASGRVSERVHGTKGTAFTDGGGHGIIEGEKPWKYEGENVNPYVQEHTDLINSIRSGKPINEGHEVARSSMMATMGRMSAYTGREVSWNWCMNASKLDLRPAKLELGDLPTPEVAVPGRTPLI